MSTLAVPMQIAPEAMAKVTELGMEAEFEAMLEHTRQTVPNLRAIEVKLYENPDEEADLQVVLCAWQNGPAAPEDRTWDEWCAWRHDTFGPQVRQWFGFEAFSWDDYGR